MYSFKRFIENNTPGTNNPDELPTGVQNTKSTGNPKKTGILKYKDPTSNNDLSNELKELDRAMQLLIGHMFPEDDVTEMLSTISMSMPEFKPQLKRMSFLFRQALVDYDELIKSQNESTRLDKYANAAMKNPYMGIQIAQKDFEDTSKNVEIAHNQIQNLTALNKPQLLRFIQSFERFYQVWNSFLPTIRRHFQKYQRARNIRPNYQS
jgi:hypothetical protein